MAEPHDHADMAGLEAFRAFRAEMNERLIDSGHLGIKRFLALDGLAYQDGALDERTSNRRSEARARPRDRGAPS